MNRTPTVASPYARLLAAVDARMSRFGPDRTAVMGTYQEVDGVPTFVVDDGRRLPHPVTTPHAHLGNRCVGIWMQGGHDIVIVGLETSPSASYELGAFADHSFVYGAGRDLAHFAPGGVLDGVTEHDYDSGLVTGWLLPAGTYTSIGCNIDFGEGGSVPDPLTDETRTVNIEARRASDDVLLATFSNTVVGPRIGTFVTIDEPHVFTTSWVLRVYVTFDRVTGTARLNVHVGEDVFALGAA